MADHPTRTGPGGGPAYATKRPMAIPQAPDEEMEGSNSEGEGEDLRPEQEDSSEEEDDDDEEEARAVAEGFIVDDADDDSDTRAEKRKARRRKRKHRRDEQLDEDDLDLVDQAANPSRKRKQTERSPTPESEDDDLSYGDDARARTRHNIENIFDDETMNEFGLDNQGDEMEDFIEDDINPEEDPQDRKARLAAEKKRRRKLARRGGRSAGIDNEAWNEVGEVFGDGKDFELFFPSSGDEEEQINLTDVFEPSQLRTKLLTKDDDDIRTRDFPERMQLSTSSLSEQISLLNLRSFADIAAISDATQWIIPQIPRLADDLENLTEIGSPIAGEIEAAVAFVLHSFHALGWEVPYIWCHHRDEITHFNAEATNSKADPILRTLIEREELWRIYDLSLQWFSLQERKAALEEVYAKLNVNDNQFSSLFMPEVKDMDDISDITEWLHMKYSAEIREQRDSERAVEDESQQKKPNRISAYERSKNSRVSQLADDFNLRVDLAFQNFMSDTKPNEPPTPSDSPASFGLISPEIDDPEVALKAARILAATEIGKDPAFRKHVRSSFKSSAVISVKPTASGKHKIDDTNPYYPFKYLLNKPIGQMINSPQFLHMLEAERMGLINITIELSKNADSITRSEIEKSFLADVGANNFVAAEWNAQRSIVVRHALDEFIMPACAQATKEYIKETQREWLYDHCGKLLYDIIDVLPFSGPNLEPGSKPSVLVLSNEIESRFDSTCSVFLKEDGEVQTLTALGDLRSDDSRSALARKISDLKPDVLVIGGFDMKAKRVFDITSEIINSGSISFGMIEDTNTPRVPPPVIFVKDDIARLYCDSKRARDEYDSLNRTQRYCIGLARYVRSPLEEYASLGSDMTSVSLDSSQSLLPKDRLLMVLERILVNAVNDVGVDINRAVSEPYYAHLLQFVSGLGPRKAQALITRIVADGGFVSNRAQIINMFHSMPVKQETIAANACGFIYIATSEEHQHLEVDSLTSYDPLDHTRIHPRDYELARQMAAGAMELHPEDLDGMHPSLSVQQLMDDDAGETKLDELNLEEYALQLIEDMSQRKRHTLDLIRNELVSPLEDRRLPFEPLANPLIFGQLSGETVHSLNLGYIIPVKVTVLRRDKVSVILDSGVEGYISKVYLADVEPRDPSDVVKPQMTIRALVINIDYLSFTVELSIREQDLKDGDDHRRALKPDGYYETSKAQKEQEENKRRQNVSEVERSGRVIEHPDFHNFSAREAEQFLFSMPRGDAIIRPSSKGIDHLAVTWKISENIYQHIDVEEFEKENAYSVGRVLKVGEYVYGDLDEILVAHIRPMARMLELMLRHDKFKAQSSDELDTFLNLEVERFPTNSVYAFGLNEERPGYFILGFRANAKPESAIQRWPVKLLPGAFLLGEAKVGGMLELCNSFKVQYKFLRDQMERDRAAGRGSGNTSGRPVYVPGSRTPMPTGRMTSQHRPQQPGGASMYRSNATPGYRQILASQSIRVEGRTPAYAAAQFAAQRGGATPAYQTTPAPMANIGFVNPARAAMMAAEGPLPDAKPVMHKPPPQYHQQDYGR